MADIRETREREVKLDVPAEFELPELPGALLDPRTFTSTYLDTADRRLARAGVTLRRRVEKRRGLWQLKLPGDAARLELEAPGGPSGPPPALSELLVGLRGGRALEPIAVLRTRRSGIRAHADGVPVADVVLDDVAVLDGRRVRERFSEVEVEALDDRHDALAGLEAALRACGATTGDGRPKALRAIDFPREPSYAPSRSAPAREHVRAALAVQIAELRRHDPGTRLGRDSEELHDLRVATRRLRAILRAARPLLDPEWTAQLRDELRWLAGVLGPVRDLDVLIERLQSEIELLEPPERRAGARLLALLDEEREAARTTMLAALSGDRYLALLDRLETAPDDLPARDTNVTLADIAAREFARLRRAVRALPPDPPDDELHAVRIRGKRARYAAELAEGVVGKPARRFVRAAKRFQDVVGEHQDAVVAEERIRGLLALTRSLTAHLAAGRLVERERERRRAARHAFPRAWARLERKGRRAWARS
ncbi:MAG: CHAD domain-containing protein [Gaiellaceae bacterium]